MGWVTLLFVILSVVSAIVIAVVIPTLYQRPGITKVQRKVN